jgi:predicted N-acetyltransferase YhbS
MTMSPATTIRLMTKDDLTSADQLRNTAGWNQTLTDWNRLLRYQPDGCFVATLDDRIVGTVTTTCYPGTDGGPTLAWIGMMLVDADFRRQGIGTLLMTRALEFLATAEIDCIKLDATPTGAPVYEHLGFKTEWAFHRWTKALPPTDFNQPASSQPLPSLELDHAAFGMDRSRWLKMLADDSTVVSRDNSFGMLRSGSTASYLGPITATSDSVAIQIINDLLSGVSGIVYWDIPACEQLARQLGFEPVRDLTRMWTGQRLIEPNLNLQFALSDPGTG